jgi:tetratricopeptide (TPR) repeat protein
MFLGFMVQLIGISVRVDAIEIKRIAAGNVANNAWVFVTGTSPILSDLQDLAARRFISPWAIRALAIPDFALLLLIVLIAIMLFGGGLILQSFETLDTETANARSRALPITVVMGALAPILIGMAISRPLNETPRVHGYALLNDGVAEQRAGHVVTAEEDYALVLTLYPENKFAWFNMAVLQQEAGHIDDAIVLYQRALRADPNFSPAKNNLEYIMRTYFQLPNMHPH